MRKRQRALMFPLTAPEQYKASVKPLSSRAWAFWGHYYSTLMEFLAWNGDILDLDRRTFGNASYSEIHSMLIAHTWSPTQTNFIRLSDSLGVCSVGHGCLFCNGPFLFSSSHFMSVVPRRPESLWTWLGISQPWWHVRHLQSCTWTAQNVFLIFWSHFEWFVFQEWSIVISVNNNMTWLGWEWFFDTKHRETNQRDCLP